MFIQGCTCGAGDVCSYRAVHVGLVMYVHTGLYSGAGMYVHTGLYMWGW